MKTSIRIAWVVAVFAASTAFAAPKISVLPFKGPKSSVSHRQVSKLLCASYACVSTTKVSRRGRPIWSKVKAQKLELVMTGAVSGPSSKRKLRLEAFDGAGHRLWLETLGLARNGMLTRTDAEQLTAKVDATLAPPPEAEPETAPPPEPTAQKPVVVEPEQEQASPSETTPEERRAPVIAQAPREEETPAFKVHALPPMVVAEVGVDFVYRNFGYTGLQKANLRAYETRPAFVAPELHLEIYPLARILSGIAQGVGVEADYQFAVGLRSIDENDLAHSTTANRLDVAARLNFQPSDELMVAPLVGYRSTRFEVGAAADGSTLQGIPGLQYDGLTVGAAVEYALSPVVIFGRAQFVPLFGVGEIGSDAFFPKHSGWAIDARAGVGYRIIEHLELRAAVEYSRYALSFQPAEDATYVATGATDQYVSGALLARVAF